MFTEEVNAEGHRLKTPLHKARSPKVVKLLMDYGADEYLKMMDKIAKDLKLSDMKIEEKRCD